VVTASSVRTRQLYKNGLSARLRIWEGSRYVPVEMTFGEEWSLFSRCFSSSKSHHEAYNEQKLRQSQDELCLATWTRVVNGPPFEARTRPEPEITSPKPTFVLDARFGPESQIYGVSQDVRNCGIWLNNWRSKVNMTKQFTISFYWRSDQLHCFNSNWRQKCVVAKDNCLQARNRPEPFWQT